MVITEDDIWKVMDNLESVDMTDPLNRQIITLMANIIREYKTDDVKL